jgi:glutaredoxin
VIGPILELYTRTNCPACVELKKSLSDRRIRFTERVLDSDIPTADVVAKFPGVKAVPILAIGKHVLGGVDELQTLIENDHLQYLA